MTKWRLIFQDLDGIWKPLLEDGSLFSEKTAKKKVEALKLLAECPVGIEPVVLKKVCPHCKCEVGTELEIVGVKNE